jgi:hypothetical protein
MLGRRLRVRNAFVNVRGGPSSAARTPTAQSIGRYRWRLCFIASAIDIDHRIGKRSWRFLRQVVPDATRDDTVRIPT